MTHPARVRPDLCSDSAGLVHENERRWQTFRHRVAEVLAAQESPKASEEP